MGFREHISRLLKRRRQYRQAPLRSAAAAELQLTLAIQELVAQLRAAHAATNPLLAHGNKVFSQNDEDGIIREIAHRLKLGEGSAFFEIGVGDGSENNTLNLLAQGRRGVWLGGEPLAYHQLSPRLRFRQCWITQENVVGLIQAALAEGNIRQIDLFSLDIDGNDWHIAKTMLEAGIRPSVFALEYNGTFDAHSEWVMPYNPTHVWDGSAHFSASLASYHRLMAEHGYFLVACNVTGANAFFVKNEFKDRFTDLPDDWRAIYMPANYLPYPYLGHPVTPAFISELIAR